MTAPRLYRIEVRTRDQKAWRYLTQAGQISADPALAWVIEGHRAAEQALARNRGLHPRALWRIVEHQLAPRLDLVRPERHP